MNWLHLISYFFGGIFLPNVGPHFVSGVMGRPFQTPFAKPSGKGSLVLDDQCSLGPPSSAASLSA